MIFRIVQFLFGCSRFAVAEIPGRAVTNIVQCQRRAFHKGSHQYEKPWVALYEGEGYVD